MFAKLARWQDAIHSILRIVAGIMFLQHGTAKLLGFPMDAAFAQHMAAMPNAMLWISGLMELVGGAFIAIGLFTRPMALLQALFLGLSYVAAHLPRGLYPLLNDGELILLYGFVFLWLSAAGPGSFSIDGYRKRQV